MAHFYPVELFPTPLAPISRLFSTDSFSFISLLYIAMYIRRNKRQVSSQNSFYILNIF